MLLTGDQLRRVIDIATNLVPPQHRDLFLKSLAGHLRAISDKPTDADLNRGIRFVLGLQFGLAMGPAEPRRYMHRGTNAKRGHG
jgi:hypothetical protein